jgi:ferredoxin-NADP reductase
VLLTLPIREVLSATPRARIVRLDLGNQAFTYLPGQAVLIARHGYQLRRPYSLAGSPEDAAGDHGLELLVGVDAEGGAGPHLTLEPGAMADVEGPLGRFTFPSNPEEDRFVFIAGGTGIAPLRAMLRHALQKPHRQIGLLYSARTPGDFAYERELQSLAREGRIELRQTVTRELEQADWSGGRGRLGRADLAPLIHDPATMCFVCGPPALVEEIPRALDDLGIVRARIRIEEWT